MGNPDSTPSSASLFLRDGVVELLPLSKKEFLELYSEQIRDLKIMMKEFTAPKIQENLGPRLQVSEQICETRAVMFLSLMIGTDGFKFYLDAQGKISLIYTKGEWLNPLNALQYEYKEGLDVAYVCDLLWRHGQPKVNVRRYFRTATPNIIEVTLGGIREAMETLRRPVQKRVERITKKIDTLGIMIARSHSLTTNANN